MGKNKSGFIAEVKNKRLNPYGLLANRTIGLSREFIDSDGKVKNLNVGLEHTYDSILRGETGKKLVRYIAGGVYVPVEGYEIEPEQGKDVVTTLDVNIQDITENALLKMMQFNECDHGTCIVMEVKTGKIKAIANLGKNDKGEYWEDLNYAIQGIRTRLNIQTGNNACITGRWLCNIKYKSKPRERGMAGIKKNSL